MVKLLLKNEINKQIEECTERLLKEPDLSNRKLIEERRNGLLAIKKICDDRNRY